MKDPLISIIVPAYKVEAYIESCLSSLLQDKSPEIEIIVIDEGDLDATRSKIDKFKVSDCRIIGIHEKFGGYGASCNHGIEKSRGKYVLILEGDDFFLPNSLPYILKIAAKEDLDIIKFPYATFKGNEINYNCELEELYHKFLPLESVFNLKDNKYLLTTFASIWSCMYKRDFLIKKNVRFPEAKGGAYVDNTFRFRSLLAAETIKILNFKFYCYRLNNPNSTTNNYKPLLMAQRWTEIFSDLRKSKDSSNIQKYLIREIYLSLVLPLLKNKFKINEIKKVCSVLDFLDVSSIFSAKRLTLRQKGIFFLISISGRLFTNLRMNSHDYN